MCSFPWILGIGKCRSALRLADLVQFQCMVYFSLCTVVTELDFQCKIQTLYQSLKLTEYFWQIWMLPGNGYFEPFWTYLVSIQLCSR